MLVKLDRTFPPCNLRFVVLAGALMAACCSVDTYAQNLPSSPMPNPNSLTNPFYGSVTTRSATDGILKLSLDEAVSRGLETNLGLKNSEVQQRAIRGETLEAIQYFLPSITVTGSTGIDQYNLAALGFGPGLLSKIGGLFPGLNSSDISLITKADVTTGQVNWDQLLFSGPIIDGYKAVKAQERSAYFANGSARGEVVQQVATAYLGVIAAQSQVENAKALMDADNVLLDQANAKHEAGTAPNLDELRARVQFQQQEQTVVAQQNQEEKAEILLKRETGIAPGQKIVLTDPAPYSELTLQTPDELRTIAYQNRQDFQNLQAQLREAQTILAARSKERLPTLSFSGNYGVTNVTGVGAHGTLTAIGTLRVPLFEEGTLRGDKDVAKATLSGADLQLADLRSKIDQQVRSALLDVQAEQQLVQVARSNVDLASRALSDESDRFSAGIDDTLPLVQAQASLASAQSNLVECLYEFNQAKLRLARVVGVVEQQYKAYLGR